MCIALPLVCGHFAQPPLPSVALHCILHFHCIALHTTIALHLFVVTSPNPLLKVIPWPALHCIRLYCFAFYIFMFDALLHIFDLLVYSKCKPPLHCTCLWSLGPTPFTLSCIALHCFSFYICIALHFAFYICIAHFHCIALVCGHLGQHRANASVPSLHYIAWYSITLHCLVLHCDALYYCNQMYHNILLGTSIGPWYFLNVFYHNCVAHCIELYPYTRETLSQMHLSKLLQYNISHYIAK